MKSDDANRPSVALKVSLSHDVTLRVLDSHGRQVAQTKGDFAETLPAGRYTLEADRYGLVRRRPVWLTPKRGEVSMGQEDFDLTYSSAAPLEGVRRGKREQETPNEIAGDHSVDGPLAQLGAGSEIFLFVRAADVLGRKNPARDIRLYSLHGEKLIDLNDLTGTVAVARDRSWASIRLQVDPGNYLLRTYSGARLFDRLVPASPGLQTRVFMRYGRTDQDHWGIEPGGFSVLAGHLGRRFYGGDAHSQIADLMLRALDAGEFDLEGRVVSSAMHEKMDDPMLGVYLGIYLASGLQVEVEFEQRRTSPMLPEARDRAVSQIEMILANAAPMMPDVPDYRVLAAWFDLYRGTGHGTAPLEFPPMLAATWPLARVVESTQHSFIAPETPAYRAALVPLAAGPWFAWQPFDPRQRTVDRTSQEIPEEALAQFMWAVAQVGLQPAMMAQQIASPTIGTDVLDSDSLAEVYRRAKSSRGAEPEFPVVQTMNPREMAALSRYVVVSPDDTTETAGLLNASFIQGLSDGNELSATLRDRLTGATITPAQGVASLKTQLGTSLETILSKLNKIGDGQG